MIEPLLRILLDPLHYPFMVRGLHRGHHRRHGVLGPGNLRGLAADGVFWGCPGAQHPAGRRGRLSAGRGHARTNLLGRPGSRHHRLYWHRRDQPGPADQGGHGHRSDLRRDVRARHRPDLDRAHLHRRPLTLPVRRRPGRGDRRSDSDRRLRRYSAAPRLCLLQGVPGPLLRSDPGRDPPPAGGARCATCCWSCWR